MEMCDLDKDATTLLESSSISADADYLINVLVQAGGGWWEGGYVLIFKNY